MSWRRVPILKGAVLLTLALSPMGSCAVAGEHVRAGDQPTIRSQPAPVPPIHSMQLPRTVAVVVATPSQPPSPTMSVSVRGPDGQMRQFPVEGGTAAIHYRQVILHPGDMLTIRWKPGK